ncbi:protein of unknown function [Methylocaldum szegediense]|uniref:Uncharacterized protein n=1 Tax=Methylocaldum szegediense TaxID=73780 RepID=A0ABM9HY00_9GAMM|nr:protein of unknown function [Methylocaldum szegediense]
MRQGYCSEWELHGVAAVLLTNPVNTGGFLRFAAQVGTRPALDSRGLLPRRGIRAPD